MRKLKPGEKRKIIPAGYQVRRKLGRDGDIVRIDLTFTLEEWEGIELKAYGKGMHPRSWIQGVVLKKL